MLKRAALETIGGLSKPSKIPGKAYSLPAAECKVGSKLRAIPDSVYSKCYACKGRYVFPNVQAALYRRLESINNPDWVPAMVTAIGDDKYFRWHDSGDLQSIEHLQKIIEVCKLTPNTRHWMPTRENKLIKGYIRNNDIPDNLTIRASATMIDGPAPNIAVTTSTVHKDKPAQGYLCPAPKQGNNCQDCRACWDKSVQNVAYAAH